MFDRWSGSAQRRCPPRRERSPGEPGTDCQPVRRSSAYFVSLTRPPTVQTAWRNGSHAWRHLTQLFAGNCSVARPVLKGTRENMFNLRRVFALWAVVAFFLGSTSRSHAQTLPTTGITLAVPPTGVKRDHQDYAGKVLVTQINLKDCVNEDFFLFQVSLSSGANLGNYSFEVWAGTACDMTTARPPSSNVTCWEVADARTPTYPNVSNIKVPIQQLLSGRTGGSNLDSGVTTGGTGGGDSTGTGGGDSTGTGGGATDVGGG